MRNTQHGFNLMELMTVLTVLAVLAAIATPSFRRFSANSRTVAGANALVNALAVARGEALRRSTPVAVCASANSQTCDGNPATDWSNGWIAFIDGTGQPGTLDGTDVLVQAWQRPAGNVTVALNALNNTNYIRFDARGMKIPLTAATFTVSVAGCSGNNVSQIAVTATGSPQTTKVACP